MEKLDKVIKALECCLDDSESCPGCYLNDCDGCIDQLKLDVLEVIRDLTEKLKQAKDGRLELAREYQELKEKVNWTANCEIYPLTVVCDRYIGTYSGGAYTAWNLDPWDVPQEIEGSDGECREFWWSDNVKRYVVGKGATVTAAVANLARKMREIRTCYCPLCDKHFEVRSNDSSGDCPDCGHHVVLREVEVEE